MNKEMKEIEALLEGEVESLDEYLGRTLREEKALKGKTNSFEGMMANNNNNSVKDLGNYIIPLGKYTGRKLSSFQKERIKGYITYMKKNHPDKPHWEPVLEAMRKYLNQ